MSTLTQDGDRSSRPGASIFSRLQAGRRLSQIAAVVVLGWSIVELVGLLFRHTLGPELYGVLVAALAVAGGVLDVILLSSSARRFWISVGVLALWAIVALGGLAGVVAHIVGPVPGHGPVDLRPRPITAPLVFTLLGAIGGAALFFGQRQTGARSPERGKE